MSTWIDLSHRLQNGMPYFPDTPRPEIADIASIEQNGYREKRLDIVTHLGTHMDAPAHIRPDGRFLDELPPARFAGTALLIDCREFSGAEIPAEVLNGGADIGQFNFILFHTGWDRLWHSEAYFHDFPVCSAALAERLARSPLSGLGVDAVSFDTFDSTALPVHNVLLGSGKILIENLSNLGQLPSPEFEFYCFPLKIVRADGSPVRAMARLND